MLLSIVVPIYNVEKYLHRCIDSMLHNNVNDEYEIILVDDGSLDGSSKICDEYALEHNYITVFHKENGGLSDARNAGIMRAKGKYIMFIDSDDYVERGAMQKICSEIKSVNCDIYCTNYKKVENGYESVKCYKNIDKILSGTEFLRYQLKNKSMQAPVWQNIYNLDFLKSNDLFFKKGIYHEDEQWVPRAFLTAKSVKLLDFTYYVYEVREGSIMKQKDFTKHILDLISTVREILDFAKVKVDNELFSLIKDSLVDKYLSLYSYGNFGYGKKEMILKAKFLRKDLVYMKTKIKLLVFSIDRRLFCKVTKLYNMRKNYDRAEKK